MEKLVRLKCEFKAGFILLFIGTLMISVLFGNGMHIIWHGEALTRTEPVASGIATAFSWLTPTAAMVLYYVFWWIHTITILEFLEYIPQSKHSHLIAAPINVFLSKRISGKLKPIDFDIDEDAAENEEDISFGAGKMEGISNA